MRSPISKIVARRTGNARRTARSKGARLKALAILLLLPCAAAAQSFSTKVDYAVGREPAEVILHDFNADGVADLATANAFDGTVSVLLGVADGTFRPAANYDIAGGAYTDSRSLAAADFNSDGKPDIAVSNFNRSNVSVLRGNGDGTFSAPTDTAVSGNPHSVAAADLNGDGRADLVVAGRSSNTVSLLLGNGDGTFKPEVKVAAGAGPNWVSVADLDGDGRADLSVSNYYGNNLSMLLGNGDGTFKPAANYAVGDFPLVNRAADLNGDGKLDLFVANPFSAFVPLSSKNSVSVLLGNGDGTFKPAIHYAAALDPRSVAAADLNADGKPDLVTANYLGDAVSVLVGNGDGTFQAATGFPAGARPASVAARDFNGDGRADLVVANSTRENPAAGVMLNHAGALSISGSVRNAAGAGIEGVTVTVAGSASGVVTTSASGAYAFNGLPAGGTYTVTPSKFNTVFAPASRAFNSLTADATGDFVGSPPPPTPTPTPTPAPTPYPDVTFSGRVTNSAGVGLPDVTVTLVGNVTGALVTHTDANGDYVFRYAPNNSLFAVPSKQGYVFDPGGQGPVSSGGLYGNFKADFVGTPSLLTVTPGPVLLTVPHTDRALAFDSVTLMSGPFPFSNPLNLSADPRTRLVLFAAHVALLPGETTDALAVRAETTQGATHALPVEHVTTVPGFGWLTQIVVRLPDELAEGGEFRLSLSLRNRLSNKTTLSIRRPGL